MATPRIYTQLQRKLYRFSWGFFILNIVFGLLALTCFLHVPRQSDAFPLEVKFFIAFVLGSSVMMVLSMISTYQQESNFRLIQFVGKLYKALIPKPTQWGEALHINFMVIVCVLMAGFLVFVSTRF